MKKWLLCILLSICLLNITCFAEEETVTDGETTEETEETENVDTLGLEAPSAILIDEKTGMVLYEKNAYEKMYPASITKILTGYLACENLSLSDVLTCSNDAIFGFDRSSSHVALDVGEEASVEDLMNAMIMMSANDAANVLAEGVSGTQEAFVELMNQTVSDLGLTGTHFTNAHGLPDENHYTTAYDMAMITRLALTNSTFKEIFGALDYTMQPTNLQSEQRYFYTGSAMLKGSYYYEYATGSKLGYTSDAGYTMVTSATKGNMDLIAVVLGCSDGDARYRDTLKLFEYGFDNYKTVKVDCSDVEDKIVELKEDGKVAYKVTFSTSVSFNVLLSMSSDESLLTKEVVVSNDQTVEGIKAYVVLYLDNNEIGRIEMDKRVETVDNSFEGSTWPVIQLGFNIFSLIVLLLFILFRILYFLRNNRFMPK